MKNAVVLVLSLYVSSGICRADEGPEDTVGRTSVPSLRRPTDSGQVSKEGSVPGHIEGEGGARPSESQTVPRREVDAPRIAVAGNAVRVLAKESKKVLDGDVAKEVMRRTLFFFPGQKGRIDRINEMLDLLGRTMGNNPALALVPPQKIDVLKLFSLVVTPNRPAAVVNSVKDRRSALAALITAGDMEAYSRKKDKKLDDGLLFLPVGQKSAGKDQLYLVVAGERGRPEFQNIERDNPNPALANKLKARLALITALERPFMVEAQLGN